MLQGETRESETRDMFDTNRIQMNNIMKLYIPEGEQPWRRKKAHGKPSTRDTQR